MEPDPWPEGHGRGPGPGLLYGNGSVPSDYSRRLSNGTAPSDASAVVQQELSNLKALKRLSLGATTSPLDPDLPQIIPDSPKPAPSSPPNPSHRWSAGSSHSMLGRESSSLGRQASQTLRGQGSPNNNLSRSSTGSSSLSDRSPVSTPSVPRRSPARDSELDSTESGSVDRENIEKLLWVPAHVHPELAPNEWRSFVQEKLSEGGSSGSRQSSPPSSRLSHVVTEETEYMDASELLDWRRRRSQGSEDNRRRSILELGAQLQQLGELESLATSPVDDRPMLAASPMGGATGLRRTLHSTRRVRPRISRPASLHSRESSRDFKDPDQNSVQVSSHNSRENSDHGPHSTQPLESTLTPGTASTPVRDQDHRQSKNTRATEHRDQSPSTTQKHTLPPENVRSKANHQDIRDTAQRDHEHEQSKQSKRTPLKVNTVVATTLAQPPSPSAAAPAPGASGLLGYRRKPLHSRDSSQASTLSTSSATSSSGSPDASPSEVKYVINQILDKTLETPHDKSRAKLDRKQKERSPEKPSIERRSEDKSEKSEKRWRWLDGNSSKEIANLFKSRRDKEKDKEKDKDRDRDTDKDKDKYKDRDTEKDKDPRRKGHSRTDSRTANVATHEFGGPLATENEDQSLSISRGWQSRDLREQIGSQSRDYAREYVAERIEQRSPAKSRRPASKQSSRTPRHQSQHSSHHNHQQQRRQQQHQLIPKNQQQEQLQSRSQAAENSEIQLPYDIPAHQISDRSYIMMHHRFPLHIERAIYRLSHMKLANPRRPLAQQVLLSNFMYAYLNLINQGYQQQQIQQMQEHQNQIYQSPYDQHIGGRMEPSMQQLEAEQLAQLQAIEYQNMELYRQSEDSSSSSSDEEDVYADDREEDWEVQHRVPTRS